MSYLKSLGIFFLLYSIFYVIYFLSVKLDKDSHGIPDKFIGMIMGLLLGGFWVYLLFKLI